MTADDDDLASFYATFNKSVSASGPTTIPPRSSSLKRSTTDDEDVNDTNSPVRLRSMYVSSMENDNDSEAQNNNNYSRSNGRHTIARSSTIKFGRYSAERALPIAEDDDDIKEEDEDEEEDLYQSEPEPVTLPESTHSLFFTQPFCSLPVGYAISIVVISFMIYFVHHKSKTVLFS